ncbi:MAG: hypothetical protein JNM89_06610 [Hyphomicrobiaceae bacterium]|nr:hypothetical protein [Hyphomicrobiaceae bacterium]
MTDETFDQQLREARLSLRNIRCEVAELRIYLALKRIVALSHKAGFNPGQLRLPGGQPGGGRWTGGNGGDVILVGARGRGSVSVRIGNRTLDATPAQAARYAVANLRAEAAFRRVQEIDPTWRPRPSLTDPNSIEGQIRHAEVEAREAEARLGELARARFGDNQGPPLDAEPPRGGTGTPSSPPSGMIGSFRTITGMPDTGSGPALAKSDGTVAYLEVDGQGVFGVNSNAPGYTVRDEAMARDMRARLIERYPDIMNTGRVSYKPNDALFHAEANALLRAAEPYGGTLAGRTLEMRVDRPLCPSCDAVLPHLGTQIGNPTVRIIDGAGDIWIMRDGMWIRGGRR